MQDKLAKTVLTCTFTLLSMIAVAGVFSMYYYTATAVCCGSMEPTIHNGDCVVIRRALDQNLTGKIISFWYPGYNLHLLHRVVHDFGTYVITKGDNNKTNPSPEAFGTFKDNIYGQVVYIMHSSWFC